MCGIFGVLGRARAGVGAGRFFGALETLFALSESRGKESAGLHAVLPDQGLAWTLRAGCRAGDLLRSKDYAAWREELTRRQFPGDAAAWAGPMAVVAHSRLVTNGAAERMENNQPVRSGKVSMIHNGIVVNVEKLWTSNPDLPRKAEVDTEVLAALADRATAGGQGPEEATARLFALLEGSASIAWTRENAGWVVLATNTGDLYYRSSAAGGYLAFASERRILERALAALEDPAEPPRQTEWLAPGRGLRFGLADGSTALFDLSAPGKAAGGSFGLPVVHRDLAVQGGSPAPAVSTSPADERLLRYREASLRRLRRCSRCVLPETFPFIRFDGAGVCNFCRYHQPRYRGLDPAAAKASFIARMSKYRSKTGSPDVLVALSGGRDSSYGLHLIKKEFGLTPITFTYDWGMVTDLARRNIARMCGRLGVQNILVSADIRQKRENIRKNVAAWLRKPDLGLVPLFMAGDKQFFSIVNQLKRETGIRLDLWCANPYENTDFKAGFCGVSPDAKKERVDSLSVRRKVRLAAYYGWGFLRNPGYWNSSLADTGRAFLSYYFAERRDFYFLFDHLVWDEREVVRTLREGYDWELAPDTRSTWRIGDGTASFYNYIYVTARGFSEFDTFRSNQIREGAITREEALAGLLEENRPRPDTLRWYLETIGLDFNETVRRINGLDVLGLHV